MRAVADYVNAEKKKFENRAKPVEIYRLLQIDKEVPPHREFVHDGTPRPALVLVRARVTACLFLGFRVRTHFFKPLFAHSYSHITLLTLIFIFIFMKWSSHHQMSPS